MAIFNSYVSLPEGTSKPTWYIFVVTACFLFFPPSSHAILEPGDLPVSFSSSSFTSFWLTCCIFCQSSWCSWTAFSSDSVRRWSAACCACWANLSARSCRATSSCSFCQLAHSSASTHKRQNRKKNLKKCVELIPKYLRIYSDNFE